MHYGSAKASNQKKQPEALLLNSFFLTDLARASDLLKRGELPVGLSRYLGLDTPKDAKNLLTDKKSLESAIAPAMMPEARWPSPGGFPLVLLQQAAVNIARQELSNTGGLIAVNGPPGTGKTTLLRDVVAGCVLDRALAMSKFDDPASAFSASGEKITFEGGAFFHLYTLAPELKGHEILVASSNNKAVENISRELPAAAAVGRSFEDLSYFRSVADAVHNPQTQAAPGEKTERLETWGLIAAALGNAKNRSSFQQAFWWDEEHGFRSYLEAAKGDPVMREIRDSETGEVIERRPPLVVLEERPPSPETAKTAWRKTRERFLKLKEEVEAKLKELESIRRTAQLHVSKWRTLEKEETELHSLRSNCEGERAHLERLVSQANLAQDAYDRIDRETSRHLALRPGFFARLSNSRSWRDWTQAYSSSLQETRKARIEWQNAVQAQAKHAQRVSEIAAEVHRQEQTLPTMRRQLEEESAKVEALRKKLGGRMVDDSFFSQGHEKSNLAAPWLPDELHRKREDLFIAALEVHRAFIDASAQKMLHNLSVLMSVFASGAPQDEAKRKLMGDLWSTLFMVIPVLSTTFASVERMLGILPSGSIGWLLVDEGGQALPQAAVGAILRAKRTLVVGDPLQIPPVATLPQRLTSEICARFRLDTPIWAAPEASVQTLADQASAYQAAFRSDQGPRKVGLPLLVHRRCQNPMFGISNRIAYDGQMVHAPGGRSSCPIERAIGPTAWFDIDGETTSKWCPAEGDFVLDLLHRIAAAGITDPDLYIITPFRIVAWELRKRLESEDHLRSVLGINDSKWVIDHVGTIHTVQGREAESVMLVLGAPRPSHRGARNWATSTPNILNVAVSRAKKNLYVIGSHSAWSGVGYARELAGIPLRQDTEQGA